ncbi:MAG TPA: DUF3108 domain-containing protein [Gallionella sp.]
MRRLLPGVVSLVLLGAGAAAAATPTSIHASYDIYKAGITIGEVEETYQRVADRYTLVSSTRAVGIFSLFKRGKLIVRSEGIIDAQGLKPLFFSAVHEDNAKEGRSAELDWASNKLALIYQDQRNVVELPAKTQDRLSAMYQFIFLPLTSPVLEFPMINGAYLLNFKFQISTGPLLKTPAGEFATLYVDNKNQGARERTELWLATQFHNLPCKMIVTDPGGGKITQVLTRLDVVP